MGGGVGWGAYKKSIRCPLSLSAFSSEAGSLSEAGVCEFQTRQECSKPQSPPDSVSQSSGHGSLQECPACYMGAGNQAPVLWVHSRRSWITKPSPLPVLLLLLSGSGWFSKIFWRNIPIAQENPELDVLFLYCFLTVNLSKNSHL